MAMHATVRAKKVLAQVNVHAAKTSLSQLLERVERGEEIVIARAGKPVAKLVLYVPDAKKPRELGGMRDRVWVAPDAFEPETDEEIANLFRGDSGPK